MPRTATTCTWTEPRGACAPDGVTIFALRANRFAVDRSRFAGENFVRSPDFARPPHPRIALSPERACPDGLTDDPVGASAWKARLRRRIMATGTVKWFNPTKGFGFIQPDGGGQDVFVHITAVQKAGLQGLDENAKVEYELESQRGKTSAVDLKIL